MIWGWVQTKIRCLGGGGYHKKSMFRGELSKKRGFDIWQIQGGVGKKEGGSVFEGGIDTLMHTMLGI